jgi:hypothetical protein
MCASLPTGIEACLNAIETNILLHLQPKSPISLEDYIYCVLGFSGSTVIPFSEAW